MENSRKAQWANHYAIMRESQTWKNLAYLLLAFPLGIGYFVLSVVGLSTGFGLLIVWVGLLILSLLFVVWWALAAFERQLTIHLLGKDVPAPSRPQPQPEGVWEQVLAHLRNSATWKGAAFLLLKFPMGIASFVVTTTVLSMSVGLLFAPFVYQSGDINIFAWEIDTLFEAVVASGLGLYLTPFAFRITNGLAQLWGQVAAYMLGGGEAAPKEKQPEDVLKTA